MALELVVLVVLVPVLEGGLGNVGGSTAGVTMVAVVEG